jgi:DNA repair photolyase
VWLRILPLLTPKTRSNPDVLYQELPGLLAAAAASGASFAAYVPVRLPGSVRPIFEDWLERHFPDRREKELNRIRSMPAEG